MSDFVMILTCCTLTASLITLILALITYRSAPKGERNYGFIALFIVLTFYTAGYAAELQGFPLEITLHIVAIEYIGIALAPTILVREILKYQGTSMEEVKPYLVFLFIIPAIILTISWSDLIIPLLYQNGWMTTTGGLTWFEKVPGIAWYLMIVWNILMFAVGSTILAVMLFTRGKMYQKQTLMMFIGVLLPFFAFVVKVELLRNFPIEIAPFALIISGLIMMPAISRYQILNIIPVAHETVFNNLKSGLIVFDVHGKVRDLNPAAKELLDVTNEVIGEDAIVALPQGGLLDKLAKSLVPTRETIKISKGLTVDHFIVDVVPFTHNEIIRAGVVFVFTKITEWKEKEDHLRESAVIIGERNSELESLKDKLENLNNHLDQEVKIRTREIEDLLLQKDQFIKQIAHDLRTPLIPLVGLIPFLIEQENDPDVKRLLGHADDSVRTMQKLVENLIHLAHLNSMHSITDIALLDVKQLVDTAIELSNHDANIKKIRIYTEIEPGLKLSLSPVHGPQILPYILSNAIHYNKTGGSIYITGKHSRSDKEVIISVKDTGIGLKKEDLEKIFEEFYKVDQARRDIDAKGLGLSLVKRIVTLSHGRVVAESDGPDTGSTFILTFPAPHVGKKNYNIFDK